jgi:hypothetical protein
MHSGNLVTSGENYGTLVRNGHGDKISFNFIHIIITLHLILVAESLEHQNFFKKKAKTRQLLKINLITGKGKTLKHNLYYI